MRLRELAGQEHALGVLSHAVESGRLAHAYLFDGPSGVGKRSVAIALGMAMACPDSPREGCGVCDVCRRILAGHHPDVRLVAAASAQILIDQAQEIVALASGRPHEAPARVIVIEEADRLNPSAANCLLKTLEEPFPGNHIVLITAAPDRLLPTIRSRTQRVRFTPVAPATLTEIACKRGIDRARAETAAALAAGSVARLWELIETETDGKTVWDGITKLRHAAAGKGMGAIFDTAAEYGDKEGKQALPELLTLLGRLYRDALAIAAGAPELVLLREQERELARLAGGAGGDRQRLPPIRRALEAVVEAEQALAANVNPLAALERMLMELRPCEQGAT